MSLATAEEHALFDVPSLFNRYPDERESADLSRRKAAFHIQKAALLQVRISRFLLIP